MDVFVQNKYKRKVATWMKIYVFVSHKFPKRMSFCKRSNGVLQHGRLYSREVNNDYQLYKMSPLAVVIRIPCSNDYVVDCRSNEKPIISPY